LLIKTGGCMNIKLQGFFYLMGTIIFLILLSLPAAIGGCMPPESPEFVTMKNVSEIPKLLEEQNELLKEQNKLLEELVEIERNRRW